MLGNKKGGISIAITILVILTFALVLSSLFYFITRKGGLEEEVGNYLISESVNSRVEIINFNIQQIIDESYVVGDTKEEFIVKFLEELDRYKVNDKYLVLELGQLESQLEEKVVIVDKNVEISFEIEVGEEREGEIKIDHKYLKTFINR